MIHIKFRVMVASGVSGECDGEKHSNWSSGVGRWVSDDVFVVLLRSLHIVPCILCVIHNCYKIVYYFTD